MIVPRPLRKEFAGAKYHVSSRGNGRRRIFHSDGDRERFLWQAEEALRLDGVILYAYVLMSNHYHLLVETPRGNLSRFMHRLNTAYSTYYRYQHRQPGSVLQPRYKAPLVEGDEYLIRLTRYIHLNPIKIRKMEKLAKARRIEYLKQYRWSSYRGYGWKGCEEQIVNYRWRGLIGGRSKKAQRAEYRRYIESMVEETDDVVLGAMKASVYAIGDESFVAEVEDELREQALSDEQGDVAGPQEQLVSVATINQAVCAEYGCKSEDLRKHGHAVGEAKGVAIELVCKLGGMSNRETGREYGRISGAAVGRQRRRLNELLQCDQVAADRFAGLLSNLSEK